MAGLIQVGLKEQRQQVANKMNYYLHVGMRGILGDQVEDRKVWLAEAKEVIAVLTAQIENEDKGLGQL
jgi:hypothetical protein